MLNPHYPLIRRLGGAGWDVLDKNIILMAGGNRTVG